MKPVIRLFFIVLCLWVNDRVCGQSQLTHGVPGANELFVSPLGNDSWSGELAEPNGDHSDGPLASLEEVQRRILRRKGITSRPEINPSES